MDCKTKDGKSNLPISIFIERQLPDWAVTDHPRFQLFLEAYYEWLESPDGAHTAKYCLKSNLDVDGAIDEFLEFFKKEYLHNLPKALFGVNECNDYTFTAENGKYKYPVQLGVKDISQVTVYIDGLEVDQNCYKYSDSVTSCAISQFDLTFDDTCVTLNGGEQVLVEVCDVAAVDERLLIKIIKEFNVTRGTEASYRLLFRLLFNEDITIEYPNRNLLIPSDGKWDGSNSLVTKSYNITVSDTNQRIYPTGISVDIDSGLTLWLNGLELDSSLYCLFEVSETDKASIEIRLDTSVGLVLGDVITLKYPLYEISGDFLNEDGKLSSFIVLQDGFKNQQFSYVIKSERTLDEYSNIVKNMLHPAGLIMFGEIELIGCIGFFVEVGLINDMRCFDITLAPSEIYSSIEYEVSGTPQLGPTWGSFDIWKIDFGLFSQGESNTVMGDFDAQIIQEIEDNPNKKINILLDSRIDVYPTP